MRPIPAIWPKIHRHTADVMKDGQKVGERVLASAALVKPDQVLSVLSTSGKDWQAESWELFDRCPELRFGLEWLAAACSRVRLFVGRVDPDGSTEPERVETDDPDAERLLAPLSELFASGQADMIKRLVYHLSIPGESYLAGFRDPEWDREHRRWVIVSREEVGTTVLADKRVTVDLPDRPARATLDLADGDVLLRMWRPHPRRAIDPDSAMLALRPVIKEILSLSAHVSACADSRLAGAGILAVADEFTIPDERQSENVNPIHADPLSAALIKAAAASLKDRDSASALVPILLRGPADYIKEGLKHITFATPFDDKVLALREAAIRRVATGLDIPAEIVLGLGEKTNHWSAYLLTEQALATSVAPTIQLICEAFTALYLRPAYEEMGIATPESYAVGYDMTALAQRPDRTPQAQAAWDRMALSDAALIRALGFDESDAPDAEERKRRIIEKIVETNANLAPYLLPCLGITAAECGLPVGPADGIASGVTVVGQDVAARPAAIESGPAVQDDALTGEPSTDNITDGPGAVPAGAPAVAASAAAQDTAGGTAAAEAAPGDTAQSPDALVDAVITAAAKVTAWRNTALEIGVLRALERAGNWLLGAYGRSYRSQLADVPLREIHTRLTCEEAWLDRVLKDGFEELTAAVADRPCLTGAVDRYVRALLVTGTPHERQFLDEIVASAGCDAEDPFEAVAAHAAA